MAVLFFLLILSFLVIIHELGHLFSALWAKVKVSEFGVGYPPKAITLFTWRKIPFTLNWLPFGGFVKMEGEDGPEEVESGKLKVESSKSGIGPFYSKSKRARLVILLAGVFMNFLFGVIAFSVIYTKMGIPVATDSTMIGEVAKESPAEQAGLQFQDRITKVQVPSEGEVAVSSASQVVEIVNQNLGETLVFTVLRDGEEQEYEIYARTEEERAENQGAIGVGFSGVEFVHYPWWQMPFRGTWLGIQQSIGLSLMILQAFVNIFVQMFTQGQVPQDVAGPVGIVDQAARTGLFDQGWLAILNFAALLSINLAILNLLPIPALDGGRVVFVLLETVIGPKRREWLEGKSNIIGFAFLFGLIILITIKDVWTIIAR